VLLSLGWRYLGGGSGFEKIHPATYMFVATSCISLLVDRMFRWRVTTRLASDSPLLAFFSAVTIVGAYCCLAKGASVTPFIDTLLVAIWAAVIVSSLPSKPLSLLRHLLDLFFIISIVLIVWEVGTKRSFLFELLRDTGHILEAITVFGLHETVTGFSRASGLFGHPLDAGMLLGIYCLSNLIGTPVGFSWRTIGRLSLAVLSYIAIFPTGARTALVATTIAVVLYLIYCAGAWIFRGVINKTALWFFGFVAIMLVPVSVILWNVDFFQPMFIRFEFDYGSALSRDYALDILQQVSSFALWFGLSVQDVLGLQHRFGLIAIEISWINFILVGGLATTIPLFITYLLFLFHSVGLSCKFGAFFISTVILATTTASNGIWSKTTALTISVVLMISLLDRGSHFMKVETPTLK
jgi:hypothetical protein